MGLGTLKIDGTSVYCGSCQKEMELGTLKIHLEGDGHKLNTLWNYDKFVLFKNTFRILRRPAINDHKVELF